MSIRLATKEDNAALLNLSKSAPQEGVLSYYSDQSPDFFHLISLMGDDYKLWVSDSDGKINGCIAEVYRKVYYEGKIVNQIYVGELKVHLQARGMLALSLLTHVNKLIAKSGAFDIGESFILEGNERSRKLVEFYAHKVNKETNAGYAESFQLLPIKNYKVSSDYFLRKATEADIDTIVELLQKTYENHNGTPLFSREWLERETSRTPSFKIDNFIIAEKNACAAFWDQSSIRKNIVLKLAFSLRFIKGVLAILRPIVKLPPVPRIGEEIKYEYLRFPAAKKGEEAALKSIIHAELNRSRNVQQYHFIWATFHENDLLKECVADCKKLKSRAYVKYLGFSDNVVFEGNTTGTPSYVDFSVV